MLCVHWIYICFLPNRYVNKQLLCVSIAACHLLDPFLHVIVVQYSHWLAKCHSARIVSVELCIESEIKFETLTFDLEVIDSVYLQNLQILLLANCICSLLVCVKFCNQYICLKNRADKNAGNIAGCIRNETSEFIANGCYHRFTIATRKCNKRSTTRSFECRWCRQTTTATQIAHQFHRFR